MNKQENMQTEQEPSLLEVLLPSFKRKLDESGCLDLTDRIPANAYQGCGDYVMAIDPGNGAIHEVCNGTEDDEDYLGGLNENCDKVFDAFARKSARVGFIPVTCVFSQWTACYIDLYFADEVYEGYPPLEGTRFFAASEAPKDEQLELPFA